MVYCQANYMIHIAQPTEALAALVAAVGRFAPSRSMREQLQHNTVSLPTEPVDQRLQLCRRIFQCLLFPQEIEEYDNDNDDGDDNGDLLLIESVLPHQLHLAASESLALLQENVDLWLCYCLFENLSNSGSLSHISAAFERALCNLRAADDRKRIAVEYQRCLTANVECTDRELLDLVCRLASEFAPSYIRHSLLYHELAPDLRDDPTLKSSLYPACAEDYAFVTTLVDIVAVRLTNEKLLFLVKNLLQLFPQCNMLLSKYECG
jgi:hypothetical protein